jgi:hypothetical protein
MSERTVSTCHEDESAGRVGRLPATADELLAMDPVEVLGLLDRPERFEELSEEALAQLTAIAICVFGVLRMRELGPKIIPLYEAYARRVPEAVRQALAGQIRDSAAAGEMSPMAMSPFFLLEPEAHIVAMASLDMAVLSPIEDGDPLTGPKHLLEIFRDGGAKNRAGIFAGLLLLGDRRVTRLLGDARDELTRDELRTVAESHSGCVWAAVVEFWLDWLEGLPGDIEDWRFGLVAWALARLAAVMQTPEVLDGERVFPVTASLAEPIRLRRRLPFREFAQPVLRRLCTVERREPEPKVLPLVIEAWEAVAD